MTKSGHMIGPFSFCPKHRGSFYKSCGCPVPGSKKAQKAAEKEAEPEVMVEDPEPETPPMNV